MDKKRLEEIKNRLEDIHAQLAKLTPQIAASRKEAFQQESNKNARTRLEELEKRGLELLDESGNLTDEMQKLLGIPDELIAAIEQNKINNGTGNHYKRQSLAKDNIEPTKNIDSVLPGAIDTLEQLVDSGWLAQEQKKPFRLRNEFLTEPLSIVRGVRLESELSPIHRFAQSILISKDFLTKHPEYDFFAGASLIPQITSLASKLSALNEVTGNVKERLESLWLSSSEFAESTIYELLVAASCVTRGRKVEFLQETQEKTPELRVHDYPFPTVIECKKKQTITTYELTEESHIRNIFTSLSEACRKKGISGVFSIDLKIEAEKAPIVEIVNKAIQQSRAKKPEKETNYEWGSIAFKELPDVIDISLTKLYSPNFLLNVFGWDFDIPTYDGIICKVKPPDNIYINKISDPLALKWNVTAEVAMRRRARTVSSLYGRAIKQIPPGETGILYICYQDGTRPEIADNRTEYLVKELKAWGHEPSIRIPISFITRLYPRPLGDGHPDLIESAIRLCSELYGDQILFKDFPGAVYTK